MEEKTITNLRKSRNIILPEKVHIVKAIVFPIVIYGCENLASALVEIHTLGIIGEFILERNPTNVMSVAKRSVRVQAL